MKVTAIVPVALSGEDRDLTELAGAACGSHLQLEHYRDTFRRAGIAVSGEHRADYVTRLVDGGVFLYGTAEEIHQRLDECRLAGVDEVVLNTTGVAQIHGLKAAARDLLEILRVVPS